MYGQPEPQTKLRPILRPGAPRWIAWAGPGDPAAGLRGPPAVLGSVAILATGLLGFVAPMAALAFIGAFVAAVLGLVIVGYVRGRTELVAGPHWRCNGIAIEGEAFTMLEDIDARFAYAEKQVDLVPTGIDWYEVAPEVQVLLWDAAEQAAQVSQLDRELYEMRYAQPDTPQAVLVHRLRERRADHWRALLDTQREAEELARTAGNAAAAARVALASTGSLHALEVVAPSPQVIMAKGALAEAKARLSMLADVWAELTEPGGTLPTSPTPPRSELPPTRRAGRRRPPRP